MQTPDIAASGAPQPAGPPVQAAPPGLPPRVQPQGSPRGITIPGQ
jgi:hypothetical protein